MIFANAALGGLVGISRCILANCQDLSRAAARGAAGGLVAFAGRAIASREFPAAGLLGRQVSAIGAAALKENPGPLLPQEIELLLPGVVLRLDVSRLTDPTAQVLVDLAAVATAGYFVVAPSARIDWGSTLSSGAFVFRAHRAVVVHRDRTVNGIMVGGIILLSDLPSVDATATLRHERVHVLQRDFLLTAAFAPAERWILNNMGLADLGSRIQPNVLLDGLLSSAHAVFGVDLINSPFEAEAHTLVRQ